LKTLIKAGLILWVIYMNTMARGKTKKITNHTGLKHY